jgi:hypothetical protein
MHDVDSPQQTGAPVRRPPASWLHLYADGTFRVGSTTYAQRSAVRLVARKIQIVKSAGRGQPLRIIKGERRLLLVFRQGQWFRWQDTAPAAGLAAAPSVAKKAKAPTARHPPVLPCKSQPSEPAEAAPVASSEAEPPASTPLQPWRPFLAPLLLTAAMFIVSLPYAAGLRGWLVEQFRFDENTWLARGAFHTLCSHALLTPHAAALVYLAAGVLLFGFLVQRNIGVWRTLLLFAWSAGFSVGLWRFLLTPLGQAMVHDLLLKVFTFLAEKRDLGTAMGAAELFAQAWNRLLDLRGPISGAAGAVSGLIVFAVCRGSIGSQRFGGRLTALVLGTAYLALGWCLLWPTVLGERVPYLLFVAGGLGGCSFCFPDRALRFFGDRLKDTLSKEPPQQG